MIKQVSLALVALGLSLPAYAAYPSEEVMPVAPPTVNVTVPQQQGSWSVGLEALYEQVNNSDFRYALSVEPAAVNGAVTTRTTRANAARVGNDWGGHIDLSYNFAGDARYAKLGYTHLGANDSDSQARTAVGGQLFGPFAAPLSTTATSALNLNPTSNFANGWDRAHGKTSNQYDAVDLVFGQRFDFGQKVSLDAFGGLRYAEIDVKDNASYSVANGGTVEGTNQTGNYSAKSEFEGVGIRAGVNAQVRLGSGFSIVGTVAGSLLTGDFKDHATFQNQVITSATGALVSSNAQNDRHETSTRVVPELDARLGVAYSTSFTPDTGLGVELGYEAVNYFDVRGASVSAFNDSVPHQNDFGMQGPYLRVQLDIA